MASTRCSAAEIAQRRVSIHGRMLSAHAAAAAARNAGSVYLFFRRALLGRHRSLPINGKQESIKDDRADERERAPGCLFAAGRRRLAKPIILVLRPMQGAARGSSGVPRSFTLGS